jgi:hypothetical protein
LDDHDRHVVGDDVLQLECDARALREHRRVLVPAAVALELAGLVVETAVEVLARTQHAAQDEHLCERDRGREHGQCACRVERASERVREGPAAHPAGR